MPDNNQINNIDLPSQDNVNDFYQQNPVQPNRSNDPNLERYLQVWTINEILNKITDLTSKDPNVDKKLMLRVNQKCQNFFTSVQPFNPRRGTQPVIPNAQQLENLKDQSSSLVTDIDNLMKKYDAHDNANPEVLFYMNIAKEKMIDDYSVLNRMKPNTMSVSNAAKSFANLAPKYGIAQGREPVKYTGPAKKPKVKKTAPVNTGVKVKSGHLQIFSLSPITNHAANIIRKQRNQNIDVQGFISIQKDLLSVYNKLAPFNTGKNPNMILPEHLNECTESIDNIITDIKDWKINYTANNSRPSQELLFMMDLAEDKLKDDLNVLQEKRPEQKISDTVKEKSVLPSHYGLKDDFVTPIPYRGAVKRPNGNLGEFYDFSKEGFPNVCADLHKLCGDLKHYDPKLMLNKSNQYKDLRRHMEELDRWASSFKKFFADESKVNTKEYDQMKKLFSVKVNIIMNDVRSYLNKKEQDRAKDFDKGIDRVTLNNKKKYEQPRIRTALHVYETLQAMSKMNPTLLISANRDAEVEQHKNTLLSEESQRLYEQEKQPAKPQAPTM